MGPDGCDRHCTNPRLLVVGQAVASVLSLFIAFSAPGGEMMVLGQVPNLRTCPGFMRLNMEILF